MTQAMNGLRCKTCGKPVPAGTICAACDAAQDRTIEQVSEQVKLRTVLGSREDSAVSLRRQAEIIRIQYYQADPHARENPIGRLAAQPGEWTVLLIDGKEPRQLSPGRYDASQDPGFRAMLAEGRGLAMMVCRVRRNVASFPIVVPDAKRLREGDRKTELTADATNLVDAIVTVDGFHGGIELLLSLHVRDPILLLTSLALVKDEVQAAQEQMQAVAQKADKRGFFERLRRALPGSISTTTKAMTTEEVTAQHFYDSIRGEVLLALRGCIGNERAEDLMLSDGVRSRVAENLNRVMSVTLERFGLGIDRVPSFDFVCPRFQTVQTEMAEEQLARKRLEIDKARAQTEAEQLRLAREKSILAVDTNSRIRQAEITSTATTKEMADKAAAEDAARARAMEDERLKFKRDQSAADQRQEIELKSLAERTSDENQRLKIKALREEWDAQQTSEHQRRLETVKLLTTVPAEMRMEVLLALNPGLQNAYIAAKQAEGAHQQIALQERFRGEMTTVLGADRMLINNLMQEGIKQIGTVLTAKAGASQDAPADRVVVDSKSLPGEHTEDRRS